MAALPVGPCIVSVRIASSRSACVIPEVSELTELLVRANAGDEAARLQLFSTAYKELHALAHTRLRASSPDTLLDTTALVHESFTRFVQAGRLHGADRGHFFAYAASVMRSVIVDYARRRLSERRGGDVEHVTLSTHLEQSLVAQENELIAVHEALQALEATDPRLVKVVEMRFFAGLTDEEIAAALGITDRTVRRDWQRARLVLASALGK
jgi:RNA polymerase sigma factor (TIGR02999 family)